MPSIAPINPKPRIKLPIPRKFFFVLGLIAKLLSGYISTFDLFIQTEGELTFYQDEKGFHNEKVFKTLFSLYPCGF
jgi:hypothetical protein